jgi:hypothetical protein
MMADIAVRESERARQLLRTGGRRLERREQSRSNRMGNRLELPWFSEYQLPGRLYCHSSILGGFSAFCKSMHSDPLPVTPAVEFDGTEISRSADPDLPGGTQPTNPKGWALTVDR